MHVAGVILMASAGVSIRAQIESRNHLILRHVAAIQIGLIGGRTASRGATRRGGCALGGGILVAWRAQLADRCNPLLCRLDEHTRRFGTDAGAPLADDGGTGGDGRYAAAGISTAY